MKSTRKHSQPDGEDSFAVLHEKWVRPGHESKEFKNEVGQWKTGRWSVEELRTLKRNVRAFKKEQKVKDLNAFIFNHSRGEHSTLYRYISKDIQRPLYPIYRKMLRVFDVTNHVGQWTKDQEKELLRLHGIHGNCWSIIGRALGMSGSAAHDKYRLITKRKKTGFWSEAEEQSLISAVERYQQLALDESESGDGGGGEVTVLDDIRLPSDVTWDTIAEHVPTRNALQCRKKWLFKLSWKQRGGTRQWGVQDDLKLLQCLSAQDAADEEEVEWVGLSEGWDSVRSPHHLRNKWACLRRAVPNYHIKTFQENLEHLVEHRLPALESQLAGIESLLESGEEDSPG